MNAVVLGNTVYRSAALEQLRAGGQEVRDDDVASPSPLGFKHLNFLGSLDLNGFTAGSATGLARPERAR